MKKTLAATAVTAGTVLARTVVRRRQGGTASALSGRAARHTDPTLWRSVTVMRRGDEMRDVTLGPLTELGDAVEVDVHPAPDGKGTVISARWKDAPEGGHRTDAGRAVEELRAALRRTKQELEIGWQVTPTRSPVEPTPWNRPLREADEHAFGGGVR